MLTIWGRPNSHNVKKVLWLADEFGLSFKRHDMGGAFGTQRRAAVCRELTKVHEEVVRGTLEELVAWASDGVLGEITVVLAGATPRADLPALVARVEELAAGGVRVKGACNEVAAAHPGVRPRQLYDAVLRSRNG